MGSKISFKAAVIGFRAARKGNDDDVTEEFARIVLDHQPRNIVQAGQMLHVVLYERASGTRSDDRDLRALERACAKLDELFG